VRKSVLVSSVVVASLALAACGSSPSSKKAALDQFVASLGASPTAQVHLTAAFTGAGTSAKDQAILKAISFDVNVSNPSGAPLSQAGTTANTELLVNIGSQALLDVRDVGGNIYLKVDATALSSIPGTGIPASEIEAIQVFLGGKWFELPTSLLRSLVHKTKVPKAQIGAEQAAEAGVVDALTNLIDHAPYTTLSNGFSETGTLKSVVAAVTPTIDKFAHSSTTPKAVKGSYTLVLTTSGSTVTGGTISITAPNGTKGNATGSVTATVAHANVKVVAPSGATPITKGLLSTLGLSKAVG
jgi:hypothetical protein